MEAKGPTGDDTQREASEEEAQVLDSGQSESFDGGAEPKAPLLSPIDRQYSAQSDVPLRIHIAGTGSIGKLVAHSLRGIADPPPVTLILHKYQLLQAWGKSKKVITIQDGEFKVARGGFDVELQPEVRRQHGVELEKQKPDVYTVAGETMRPDQAASILGQGEKDAPRQQEQQPSEAEQASSEVNDSTYEYQPQQDVKARRTYHKDGQGDYAYSMEPIHNLIVTTKAPFTVPALSALRHRISSNTTICFLQNGMGIIDDVNAQLFPDPANRPNYIQGILTHGVNVPPEVAQRDPFFAVHAGHGTIALGALPRRQLEKEDGEEEAARRDKWARSARYLLRTLTRTPVLCAVGVTPTELLQQQLEKLAVNSVLNPLTSLLDARNGALLFNFALTRTLRLLLAETSLVIRSLPELQAIPNINTRFSAQRLETLVVNVADKTKDNISSMLADVRAGRKTEIDYINGYIVRRGEEVGVSCVVNYGIMQTVVGKAMLTQREAREDVPMERRR